jgi:Recombination endonuclease VII
VKRCPGCGIEKPWKDFPRNKNTRDGLAFYCKICHNAKTRESKIRNNAGYSAYHRKHRYGVTRAEIEALLAVQGGKCPICRSRPPTHLDHDHETGEVRGLLCFGCNGGLGLFKDNTAWLARAVLYLKDRDSLLKDAS